MALSLSGLRMRRLDRYPHLIFYIERDDDLAIVRVLHSRRDIAAALSEPDG